MPPEFSVVLPTRGRGPFLAETLASVLREPGGIEVLLVHDRRRDEPGLDAGLTSDPRIRVLAPAAPGVSGARNAGLAEARGRLVAFIDDDDVWLAGHLEASAALLDRNPGAVMVGSNAFLLTDAQAPPAAPEVLGRLPRVLPERVPYAQKHGAKGLASDN